MTTTAIGQEAWRDLGGEPAALERIDASPVGLDSPLDVSGLLADSVGLASLAVQQIRLDHRQLPDATPIRVRGDRIATSARSERYLTIDGIAPDVWAPLSGFWQTRDGWVRTHGNYPHHAQRLAQLLGVAPDAGRTTVAESFAEWSALDLESSAQSWGAIVGAVRTPEEWAQHPHARHLASQPLIHIDHAPGASARMHTRGATPLDGVRVLDLTRVIAGPVATRNLALAGATVVRVDSPRLPEIWWQHLETGPGKLSTTLDLGETGDRATLDTLLRDADVVVTGYRPGGLDRYGLSPQALVERFPGLVVGTISAWGLDGPWALERGFDSIVQAVTGIAAVHSSTGTTPGALPAQALDHSAGHFLTAGVVKALQRQREDGGTFHVSISLAGIAQRLLQTTGTAGSPDVDHAPTVQTGVTTVGKVTCAAPPIIGPGIPDLYPALATPWGGDPAAWPPSATSRC